MFKSAKHKILNAYTYQNLTKSAFSALDKPIMLLFMLINDKMPKVIDILTFMSRKKFMLS